jgi:hypothetical protein
MATVKVSGIIHKIDGNPWENAKIGFDLSRGSYTPDALQPKCPKIVHCDSLGQFETNLWINQEGLIADLYICTMPDGSDFRFSIPKNISEAKITFLRTLTNSPTPIDDSAETVILAYLETAIADLEETRETLNVTVPGQTQFLLSRTIPRPDLSRIIYYDVVLLPQNYYSVDGRSLTWISPIRFDVGEVFDIFYRG